jgi:YVTN family beta-propeller protein
VETFTGFVAPDSLALNPTGTILYVVNANASTVSVVSTSTGLTVAIIPVGDLPTAVAVSANGLSAYVTNAYGYSLSEIDTATNLVVNTLVHVGIYPFSIVLYQ